MWAPSRRARSAWASKRATTATSTSGCSARRIATAHEPSAPAPHTSDLAAGRRRVAGDAVERHRERVGEDGVLVVDGVGHGEEHRRVGRHQLGVAAGGVARHAGVDAGADVAGGEAPAQAEVAGLAGRAERGDAPRRARQPRVEHHPLADVEAARPPGRAPSPRPPPRGPSPAGTSRARSWRCRCRPPKSRRICLESEPQMPVRSGPGHEPVGPERAGVGDVAQGHRA